MLNDLKQLFLRNAPAMAADLTGAFALVALLLTALHLPGLV
ncbi:MAG: hypothetical protein AAFX00_06385 [Pseudomonadota bacterium]